MIRRTSGETVCGLSCTNGGSVVKVALASVTNRTDFDWCSRCLLWWRHVADPLDVDGTTSASHADERRDSRPATYEASADRTANWPDQQQQSNGSGNESGNDAEKAGDCEHCAIEHFDARDLATIHRSTSSSHDSKTLTFDQPHSDGAHRDESGDRRKNADPVCDCNNNAQLNEREHNEHAEEKQGHVESVPARTFQSPSPRSLRTHITAKMPQRRAGRTGPDAGSAAIIGPPEPTSQAFRPRAA